ncbi:unnamed protein product, partial [marine sediment metagenome]
NGLAKIKVKVIEPKAETDEQDNQGDEEISAGDCGECQYLENHICVNYECCKNDDCQNNEICKIHECIKLNCEDCQYIKNHKCLDYKCCEDSDCNDNDISTNDKCINPRTTSASCSNILTDKCYSNSDCDDEDVSTKDICSGTPKKCSNTKITQCIDGDDYCPSECTHNNDDDCEIQVIDCGSNVLSLETVGNMPNFDCFIEASENCYPATLLNTLTIEFFGMVTSSTTFMELKGIELGKCIYYQRVE